MICADLRARDVIGAYTLYVLAALLSFPGSDTKHPLSTNFLKKKILIDDLQILNIASKHYVDRRIVQRGEGKNTTSYNRNSSTGTFVTLSSTQSHLPSYTPSPATGVPEGQRSSMYVNYALECAGCQPILLGQR